ncbi:hypothetical protein TrVFT333_000587 [Trichoderma virens FT-333]|nr:hypothetical protein TrVFT333_000587 [Trichoderma virens FT-333]
MALSSHEVAQLRVALQDAVVKCSERCLYQSAKWAAELLNAVPESEDGEEETAGSELKHASPIFSPNQDADEAALEAKELSKYLLAKSLFDCKEYDRCAAVFLPDSLLSTVLDSRLEKPSVAVKGKGKSKATDDTKLSAVPLPKLSQKSLFLALYAKFMSGEKRKNEESEMVMGPQDLGTVVNKQLLIVGRFLAAWFEERTTDDDEVLGSQGWLEYLYGMVLAKEKNDEKALEFLIRSVHKYPMNWGCWLEMTSLISRVEDLNRISWTLMGHEYVELKNTHAAIESYRRAVDVNRRDYRAWYGLGQTYEMLEMHTYSLWYYKKAAGLRPWDGKMWMAVGSCLQKMGRERDGIKALKRALLADAYYDVGSSFGSGGDLLGARGATGQMDPEILLQIATMYDQLGEEEESKAYMELCMAQEDGGPAAAGNLGESVRIHNDSPGGSEGYPERDDTNAEGNAEGTGVTAATSKARMWLAKFAMRTADYATANRLAAELCQDGVEVEEAKALAREVRSRLEASGMLGPAG